MSLHRTDALDLKNGRMPFSEKDLAKMADALGLTVDDLTRDLLPEERRDWDFYRVSARHPVPVWRNARINAEAAGLSNHQAARILGINRAHLTRAFAGHPAQILQRPPAQRLAETLSLRNAEVFLEGLEPLRDDARQR